MATDPQRCPRGRTWRPLRLHRSRCTPAQTGSASSEMGAPYAAKGKTDSSMLRYLSQPQCSHRRYLSARLKRALAHHRWDHSRWARAPPRTVRRTSHHILRVETPAEAMLPGQRYTLACDCAAQMSNNPVPGSTLRDAEDWTRDFDSDLYWAKWRENAAPWTVYRSPNTRQLWWSNTETDEWFYIKAPGEWQHYKDPENGCFWWWNSRTEAWFYEGFLPFTTFSMVE